MSEMILVVFGVGLTALSGCVGWLILRVIANSRDVAVIQALLGQADIAKSFKCVHDRITELSEDTHRVVGLLEGMERRQARIEDHMMHRSHEGQP